MERYEGDGELLYTIEGGDIFTPRGGARGSGGKLIIPNGLPNGDELLRAASPELFVVLPVSIKAWKIPSEQCRGAYFDQYIADSVVILEQQ